MPPGVNASELRIERLWVVVVIAGAIFSALFVILDFIIIVGPAALMCLSTLIGAPFYLWLFKKGFRTGSKVFMHVHVLAILFIITILYTEEGYAWTFVIPVLLSSRLIFQTYQRPYSSIIFSLAFLFLPAYLFLVKPYVVPMQFDQLSMHTFKLMNLSGSMGFCVAIVATLVRIGEANQKQLRLQLDENARQNKVMLGSMRTRDKLLSMMSHDIRGDIGKTIGVIDVIEQMPLSQEDQSNLLHNLKIDATKTLETLDNMLQWTRTQQDELNVHFTHYEVDRILSQQLSSHDYALNSKNQLVHLNIPPKLVIFVDRNMIDSVFRNLIGNAIKFTPVGGIISISAIDQGDKIAFAIQDSGVGMSQEQIDNILKGVQFTTRGTNREKGRGFGMVLVTEFLAKHKAQLSIESTVGKGTLFTFSLPKPPST